MAAVLTLTNAGPAALLVPAILIVLYLGIRFPEVAFMLFLNAGIYKADPRLAPLQSFVDLTLFFEALCILGILIGVRRRQVKILRLPSKMLVPYLAVAGMSVLSLIYTEAPIYGTDKLLRFLFITSFSLFAPWFLFQDWGRTKRFFVAWVVLSVIAASDVLISGLEPGDYFRSAFGGSSGYLGLASLAAQSVLVLTFAFFLTVRSMWRKLLVISLIILNTFILLASGGRTAPLVLPLILVGLLMYKVISFGGRAALVGRVPAHDFYSLRRLLTVVMILSIVALFTISLRYTSVVDRLAVAFLNYESTGRIGYGSAALQALLTHPWGLGIGGFAKYYTGSDEGRAYAHNLFLEVGSELGWIGLIAFVLLCIWAATSGVEALRRGTSQAHSVGVTLFSLYAFMLFYFQFHGDLNDARVLFAWMGALFAFRQLVIRELKCYA